MTILIRAGISLRLIAIEGESCLERLLAGRAELNAIGQIAESCWRSIPDHFDSVKLDAFIVMPSHVHGVLFIEETLETRVRAQHAGARPSKAVRARHASPVQRPRGTPLGSLGAIVGSYKSAVTRAVNRNHERVGSALWPRNYYERVIRDEKELESIRNYITFNYLEALSYKDQP